MFKKIFSVFFLISLSVTVFSQEENQAWLEKVRNIMKEDQNQEQSAPPRQEPVYKDAATYENSTSTLKLIKPLPGAEIEPVEVFDDISSELSPQAAKKALKEEKAKEEHAKQQSHSEPAPAQPKKKTKKKKEEPQKDNVNWIKSSSGNFNIQIERRTTGITTPNLAMKFETIHQILRKNIPWMMGGKTTVYVYQDRASFLKNEPVASDWTGAFFSPSDNRIVMYDEPKKTDMMIQQFSHELTHLFVENFFNPPGKGFKLEPPVWANEGLAVNMEDISINSRGGAWASDLIVLNVLSYDQANQIKNNAGGRGLFGSSQRQVMPSNRLSNKVVVFMRFSDFVKSNSYDNAVKNGNVENWYFQAYAMVRFLFKPYNATYPEKRMQFEQFTKQLNSYNEKKDNNGKPAKSADGKTIMVRVSSEDALRKAYGFKDMNDFEKRFFDWLRDYQKKEREKIIKGQK